MERQLGDIQNDVEYLPLNARPCRVELGVLLAEEVVDRSVRAGLQPEAREESLRRGLHRAADGADRDAKTVVGGGGDLLDQLRSEKTLEIRRIGLVLVEVVGDEWARL